MVNENFVGFDASLQQANKEELEFPTDKRIFTLAASIKEQWTVAKLHSLTKIDPWFLHKLKNIVDCQEYLKQLPRQPTIDEIVRAKKLGFSDKFIAKCIESSELVVRKQRIESNVRSFIKKIDTVSAEWPCSTNYLYLTYNASESDTIENGGVMVLGSGVYRIGSSVEFDCCAVGCVLELAKINKKTIMVNCNPETVSTDYDMCDKLYFEEISFEVFKSILINYLQ